MSPADNVSASSARFTASRINRGLGRWSSASRRSLWRRFAPYLGTVLALSLFGGALYLLHRQVAAYDPEDVRKALTALSWQRIIAAFGLTGASYILLIFYDALALRHMRKTLPFRRVALASFTSYAFTHSFGGEPRRETEGPPRQGPQGQLSSPAGAPDLHPEAGRIKAATEHPLPGGQGRPAGSRVRPGGNLRGRLPGLLLWIPARTWPA